MFVTYYNECRDRYTVARLDTAKRLGLDIIGKYNTYRQAEQATLTLSREKGCRPSWAREKK